MGRSTVRDRRHVRWAFQMSRGGMTQSEISEVLGYPKTTIQNWIANGSRLVRKAMRALTNGGGWE